MRVLLLTSHSIAEYDDLRMLADLGYDTFSIGAYTDPGAPTDDKRPALDVPAHPELAALTEAQRAAHASEPTHEVIDWAKADLHPDLIDWADAIIVHHFPVPWIAWQWPRIAHKRVIWRTCGQSNPQLEQFMATLRPLGLQVVRYSPAEARAYTRYGWAGQDAVIRFGKYPGDYPAWVGDVAAVGNVTQNMVGRGDACGLYFWERATDTLPVRPAGPGSEHLRGGLGALPYPAMLDYLAETRAYLYTGTQPASYTLGLMEAMLTGTPVVSIGPAAMSMPALFEGHELAGLWSDDPLMARGQLHDLLTTPELARSWGSIGRTTALRLFDVAKVGAQWKEFLG